MVLKAGTLFEWNECVYVAIENVTFTGSGWNGSSRRLFEFTEGLRDEDRYFVFDLMDIIFTRRAIRGMIAEKEKEAGTDGKPVQDYAF